MLSPKRSKASSSISHQLSSSSTSSAETIADNVDVLNEILIRLPLKSLLKFKSVSKHWLSLITDPKFSPRHNSKNISGLFLRPPLGVNTNYDFINLGPNSSRPPFRCLDFVHDPSGIRILQSCNGLFLCRSFRANRPDTSYYVYNPTTKHYTVLPKLSHGPYSRVRTIIGVGLAFDPSKSPDYKVVCVRDCDSHVQPHYQIEIYSPKTGPWRPSGGPFAAPLYVDFKNGVFWNGAIHWISEWGNLTYFDIEEEQLREMPMPVVPGSEENERLYRYFGESGGHLYHFEIYGSYSLPFDVFEMERDRSGWFPKYRVDLNPASEAFPEMVKDYVDPIDLIYYEFSVLGVVHEESEDSFLVMRLPNEAIRYNFKKKAIKKLCDFAPLGSATWDGVFVEYGCFDAYQFIESFASV